MEREVLFSALVVSSVLCVGLGIFLTLPFIPLKHQQEAQLAFIQNLSQGLPLSAGQFYPNMRFASPLISYSFGSACSGDKQRVVLEAFALLSEQTPLRFIEAETPQLFIACSEQKLPAVESDHFIAGEGGPTQTINASAFLIIQSANISLYRDERCDTPHVALHEILHALGFDHTRNETSIMYPVTNCKQTLDASIVTELTRLYTIPSYADAVVSEVNATVANGYLHFTVTLANEGLADIQNASLLVEAGMNHTFAVGELGIGKRKILSVSHVRVPRLARISLELVTGQPELSSENNRVLLGDERTFK